MATDNTDLMNKVAIRHESLKRLGRRPKLVLDMFAGEGGMTHSVWNVAADRVICIEKDAEKAAKIERAEVIVGDNRHYLHLAQGACIIDCDAYGLVMGLIERLPKNKLVAFTDGSLERSKFIRKELINFRKDVSRLFSEFNYVESRGKNVYYGWGITK